MFQPTSRSVKDHLCHIRQSSRRVLACRPTVCRSSCSWRLAILMLLLLAGPGVPSVRAASLTEARGLLRAGKYDECAKMATAAIAEGYYGEDWPLLKIESDMQRGRYSEALKTLDAALGNFKYSVRLRYAGRRVAHFNNLPERAAELTEQAAELATRSDLPLWRFRQPRGLGRLYLDRGADPRRVLETFYDPVKHDQPQLADAFMPPGELALAKNDFALAAEEFENALKRSTDDPDIHYGLARAFAPSDSDKANRVSGCRVENQRTALPTLLLVVDNKIDAEDYEAAENCSSRYWTSTRRIHRPGPIGLCSPI